MIPLVNQRCFNHALREAAARCPECGRFYCRECVTEHEDRVVCAACLRQMLQSPGARRSAWRMLVRGVQLLFGLCLVWFFFYLLGEVLVSLPSAFHEGTVWQDAWQDMP